MKESLLPHYWKKIALIIFLISIAIWIINAANPELLSFAPFIMNWILKIVILTSLLIYVSSKEKVETERFTQLRLNSLFTAVTAGGFILIIEFFTEILFQGKNAEITSGYEVMMIVLVVYSLSFFIKKNIKTVIRD